MPGMDRKEKQRKDPDTERREDRNWNVPVASPVGFSPLEKGGKRSSNFEYKPSFRPKIKWASKGDTHPKNILSFPPPLHCPSPSSQPVIPLSISHNNSVAADTTTTIK